MSSDFKEEMDELKKVKELKGCARPENFGIALSGGGIRSATFSLGVLQAIAEKDKDCKKMGAVKCYKNSLLSCFDYLSTVSGGGYVGGFLTSLFLKGRSGLDQKDSNDSKCDDKPEALSEFKSANRVVNILGGGIPHRLVDKIDADKFALTWLRNNGRYLLPSGSGDFSYTFSIMLRNLFSLHYMIGIALLTASLIIIPWLSYLKYLLLFLGVVAVALVVAYWFIRADEESSFILFFSRTKFYISVIFSLFVFFIIFRYAFDFSSISISFDPSNLDGGFFYLILFVVATILVVSLVYLSIILIAQPAGEVAVSALRKLVSLHLSKAVYLLLVSCFIFSIDYFMRSIVGQSYKNGTLSGVMALIGSAIIYIAKIVHEKFDVLSKYKDLIIKALAVVGVACLVVFWYFLAHFLYEILKGKPIKLFSIIEISQYALFLVFSIIAIAVAAYYTQFINLSSMQPFYTAKLIRAYLGATNPRRANGDADKNSRSVSEPVVDDDFYVEQLKGSLAPFHIINVTVNQTVGVITSDASFSANESLVLRDRKGHPLAITCCGQYLDGKKYSGYEKLSMGQWLGISGAAFSTGAGRRTTLSLSLLMVLANIRLGYWWKSKSVTKFFSKIKNNAYTYLYYELLSYFHGTQRDFLFLSDGGHYENTGIYELLRSERNVKFIFACDDGADPDYQFDDLANLMLLAKADLNTKIEVFDSFSGFEHVNKAFGGVHQFCRVSDLDRNSPQPLAILLKATNLETDRVIWIVLIKPRCWDGVPVDIWNYAKSNHDFPQETTTDQFFDEAQWESYRALGYLQCKKILEPEVWAELKKICGL